MEHIKNKNASFNCMFLATHATRDALVPWVDESVGRTIAEDDRRL